MNAKFNDYKFMLPIKGDKRKLLELSLSNINQYVNNEKKKAILLNWRTIKNNAQDHPKRFQTKKTPLHMGYFDNSISKVQMLLLRGLERKTFKKDYRHFV